MLDELLFTSLQCLSQEPIPLSFRNQFLWLLLIPNVRIVALLDCLGELLDFFDFLLVQVIDFLDDLERAMTLTVYFVCFVPVVLATLLVNFHTVVCPFRAFNVEIDLAVLLEAFDSGAYVDALLTTNDAPCTKLLEIEAIHFHWSLRRDLWTLRPHGTAMMHPVIQGISDRRLWQF